MAAMTRRERRTQNIVIVLSFVAIGTYIVFSMTSDDDTPPSLRSGRHPFLVNARNGKRKSMVSCPKKVAKFRDKPMIKIALASYPGAGNSWLRYLIEQTTGIATGSAYCDPPLKAIFIGECVTDNTTIVIKTHEWFDKHMYDKAVILIRSPFKSCSSHFNGEVTGDHKGVATKKQYEKMFKPFLKRMLPYWRWFNEEWMRDFVGPKYVVFYDKLKKDLKGEMRRLMKFLDAKYNERDFNCMLKNYEGDAHRTSTKKVDSVHYFSSEQFSTTEEDILYIENMAAKINGEYHKIERTM